MHWVRVGRDQIVREEHENVVCILALIVQLTKGKNDYVIIVNHSQGHKNKPMTFCSIFYCKGEGVFIY